MIKTLLSFALVLFLLPIKSLAGDYEYCSSRCVTIRAIHYNGETGGEGSGVVFIRNNRTFVWTAAHVVESVYKTWEEKYQDVEVRQYVTQSGQEVGFNSSKAKILKISTFDNDGHDLALLEVYRKDMLKKTCEFQSRDFIPKVGSRTINIGSIHGTRYPNTFVKGYIGLVGKKFDWGIDKTNLFDMIVQSCDKGQSGSAIFDKKTKKVIGILNLGINSYNTSTCLIIPVRRMYDFAEENDCLWALDRNVSIK